MSGPVGTWQVTCPGCTAPAALDLIEGGGRERRLYMGCGCVVAVPASTATVVAMIATGEVASGVVMLSDGHATLERGKRIR